MPRAFRCDIDLTKFSLIGAMLNPVSSDPGGLGVGDSGRVWFNLTSGKLKIWNGTAAIDLLDRANHSGTQLASTISDLAATVQAYPLSSFAAPTADISLASHKLTNVTDPSTNQDAATKAYVDTQIAGLASGQVLKGAVKCAATTNVNTASPGSTIDGLTMTAGDVVLLTGQSTATQNGPYVWTAAGTALTRATNWDTNSEAAIGSYWIVQEGSKADNFALLTNDSAITLGTTALTFTFTGSATYSAGNGISISSGTISAVGTTGITVSGSGIGADFAVVGRKVTGVVPTATAGIFTVSGATVTVNHGLANYAPRVTVRAYTSPASGYTQGQMVELDESASDANNVTLTFPAAPASNNWYVSVLG